MAIKNLHPKSLNRKIKSEFFIIFGTVLVAIYEAIGRGENLVNENPILFIVFPVNDSCWKIC